MLGTLGLGSVLIFAACLESNMMTLLKTYRNVHTFQVKSATHWK